MRNLLVVVMSCILGFFAVGCGASPEETEHGFTRDDSGGAIPVDSSSLDGVSYAESFEHSESGKDQIADAAASCSGACNANTCVCSGDFECCLIGCIICWEVVDQ